MVPYEASVGQRLTTRYFGGYMNVRVVEVHDDCYLVSMFSGHMWDYLPKDRVSKAFDDQKNEVWCSEEEKGPLHPAVFASVPSANSD